MTRSPDDVPRRTVTASQSACQGCPSIKLVDANGDAVDASSFKDMSVVLADGRIKF